MNKKLENLKTATWANRPPIVENASEAFNRDRDAVGKDDHHFYMVTWWGDEPAGFTRFEFTGVVSGGYEIELNDEGRKSTRALESDEWVLVFQQF